MGPYLVKQAFFGRERVADAVGEFPDTVVFAVDEDLGPVYCRNAVRDAPGCGCAESVELDAVPEARRVGVS